MSYIYGDVVVGESTYIGPYTYLDGTGGLEIGDNCSIAAGVQIYSHDTISRALSGNKAEVFRATTKIGNCCFIGPQTVVTAGVNVGSHCFISANSVVAMDLPDYSAVQGNPCKIIGQVSIDNEGQVKINT